VQETAGPRIPSGAFWSRIPILIAAECGKDSAERGGPERIPGQANDGPCVQERYSGICLATRAPCVLSVELEVR